MKTIDIVFSFDMTGSMASCYSEVRRSLRGVATRLYKDLPFIRIGMIAHGDYCDKGDPYITNTIGLTKDIDKLVDFSVTVLPTDGGDSDECYELVLHEAQAMDWQAEKRVLVMIGDAEPHGAAYRQNTLHLDWITEVHKLREMGVDVYAVQALGRSMSNSFWRGLAACGNGLHLDLAQFSQIVDIMTALCYKQESEDALTTYVDEISGSGRMNRALAEVFSQIQGKRVKTTFKAISGELIPVDPHRFQLLHVDENCDIKSFVIHTGAIFRKGKGFYQFTKKETIQESKEVVLRDKYSGDMFSGSKAREMIGLPFGERGDIKPTALEAYDVFVQSTSVNRKLMGGTMFLYEVDSKR